MYLASVDALILRAAARGACHMTSFRKLVAKHLD
jgi:hypothetical protein